MKQQIDANEAEESMKQIEAIIHSMTPTERQRPDLIGGSRKRRIARGSGTTVQDVNQLLRQFREMQKMMKMLQSNKGRGLADMLKEGSSSRPRSHAANRRHIPRRLRSEPPLLIKP
jgi:signal recognition particle GTPase